MENIKLESNQNLTHTVVELKEQFNQLITESNLVYANTQSSLINIIRFGIDYFDNLDSNFLGNENNERSFNKEADHFANNFYRLINAVDHLAVIWKIKISKNDNLKLLEDIRTLIVHSGEKLEKIKSLALEEYKDSQLGYIIKRTNNSNNLFLNFFGFENMDYCLKVWNDKYDKNKNNHPTEVDYHIKNSSYHDLSIFLDCSSVKNVVLLYIESFLKEAKGLESQINTVQKRPYLDKIPIIDNENKIKFDKITELISKDIRSGYFKENDIEYWNGFGLKRLYEYVESHGDISNEVREIVNDNIHNAISNYWSEYKNGNPISHDLPSVDIRHVFSKYTPAFQEKNYLEGQKLFNYIAPFFNTKNRDDLTDVDYLARFINATSKALEIDLNLEQSVDQLICDYFIQSIQVSIDKNQS